VQCDTAMQICMAALQLSMANSLAISAARGYIPIVGPAWCRASDGGPEMANATTTDDSDRIAKHLLIDATGGVVDEPEQAAGIRYIHVKGGQTFDYQPTNDTAKTMLALFGAKTLATNEASRVRQQNKQASGDEQVDAIRSRFDLIESGKWVDRTRVAGPRYDHPTLAMAAANVYKASARGAQDSRDEAAIANAMAAKLAVDADGDYQKKLVGTAGVPEKYRELVGRPQATADSLGDLV